MWSVWQTWKMARRAAGFLGGLLVALLLAAGPAAGATFSDPMTLSNGGVANTPAVAVTASGQVYVAWREGDDIWFNRSVQRAGSCGGPSRLEFPNPAQNLSSIDPTKISKAISPSIAAAGSGVFVVWQEVPIPGPGAVQSIRFARSTDGGGTFTSPESLTFNRFAPISPAIVADSGGGVFVAWQDFDLVARKNFVVIAQSLSGGTTSSFTYANVTANRPSSSQPSVAADGSMVHVVWKETAVWYKGFARGSTQATLDSTGLTQLSTVSSQSPKVAVHASGVTAAWFEGGSIKARTMSGGTSFGSPEPIYSSTMRLFSLSLSFGGAGRFVAWQEAPDFISPSSIRYALGTASAETLRSGSSEAKPAAPSGGQDGTDRLVASWQETVTTTEIKLAYTGGSTGGGMMPATVWAAPRVLNYRTVGRGTGEQPNFTVFIQLRPEDGSVSDIDLTSVKLNGQPALPHPSSIGDHNGDGTPDLMVKFNRDVFNGAELTAAQRGGNYAVTGNTRSGGCFLGSGDVQIMR